MVMLVVTVPGGVGTVTTSMTMQHTVAAAEAQLKESLKG